ncbi:DNA/RNA helicase domain-containing protein [Sulfolobus tengchongensis]|uniref:DNA/RNA helicase domain-containing protein n=1 Tax=Sulfolobus tengchongensis TaxID=207809 RepID=A0AAX4L424_9CREN
MHALESKNDKVILIRGGSGSGKTLVALTLFFEGLKRGYNVVLSYKNNRLINTLKYILERNKATKPLTKYIRFYSTGKVRPAGIGDDNYEETHDLAIFDEAQRMTKKLLEIR